MDNKKDYTGKVVFVGIDVHKKTFSCVSICDNLIIKRDTMPASPEIFLNYCRNNFPGAQIKSAYEAGFSGFYFHRYLIKNGIENSVVHPGSIEVSSRDRVKTDRRDALKIATQLSVGRLKGIFIPPEDQEARRSISRLRAGFVKDRSRVGNQFKSLLFTQGLIGINDDSVISQKWIDQKLLEMKTKEYLEDLIYTATQYAEQWTALNLKIKEIVLKLKEQAESDSQKEIQKIYESVPGIGLIHGRELANELGDMSQFLNEKSLFCYTGLTPSEYSSGEHVRQGHISRQGRSVLRKVLTEASWVAIKKDPSLRDIFSRTAQRRGKKRAIVKVGRVLVSRIRTCLKEETSYEIKDVQKEKVVGELKCA